MSTKHSRLASLFWTVLIFWLGCGDAVLQRHLRRLRIVWQMRRIDQLERRAATELAYERAHVLQASQNFNALLVSNQQLRQVYQQQLQTLTEEAR